jgi:hypothetical protein
VVATELGEELFAIDRSEHANESGAFCRMVEQPPHTMSANASHARKRLPSRSMLAVILLKLECRKSARIVEKPAQIGKINEQFPACSYSSQRSPQT